MECSRSYQRIWAQRKRGSKPRPIKPVVGLDEKFCPGCKRTLKKTDFSRSQGKKDGLMSHCKQCDYLRQLVYKELNREVVRAKSRLRIQRWRETHPGYNAHACAKSKRRRIARKMGSAT